VETCVLACGIDHRGEREDAVGGIAANNGEIQVGGVAEVFDVHEAHGRAALEHQVCAVCQGGSMQLTHDMREHVVAL
jgi:hypothetical protein